MLKTIQLRRMLWSIFISVVATTPGSLQASSGPTQLYLQPVPYYMESEDEGTYVELVKRFSVEQGHQFDIRIASGERVEKLLIRADQNYCALGFSVELAQTEKLPIDHLIESNSFNTIKTSMLSHTEGKVIRLEELHQKTLVVYHGNYQDARQRIPANVDTSIVTIYELQALINLVVKRRVDAGFVTSPDILMSPLYQQNRENLYLADVSGTERRETMVCIRSENNERLISSFNDYLQQLVSANQLGIYIDYDPTKQN